MVRLIFLAALTAGISLLLVGCTDPITYFIAGPITLPYPTPVGPDDAEMKQRILEVVPIGTSVDKAQSKMIDRGWYSFVVFHRDMQDGNVVLECYPPGYPGYSDVSTERPCWVGMRVDEETRSIKSIEIHRG